MLTFQVQIQDSEVWQKTKLKVQSGESIIFQTYHQETKTWYEFWDVMLKV